MSLASLIFGQRPKKISKPPENAQWHEASPVPDSETVRAWLATQNETVDPGHAQLHAGKGEDMIVEYDNGDRAVGRRAIFERTYEPAEDDRFRKRQDLLWRYFTLDAPAIIQ